MRRTVSGVGLVVMVLAFGGRADGGVAETPTAGKADKPAFTVPPAVEKAGQGYRIAVTVAGRTDVEVAVLDNEGNEITHFGQYGNRDSEGLGSAIPTPAIPLAHPVAVQVSFEHIYVADSANRRVVRADPGFAVEAECPIP